MWGFLPRRKQNENQSIRSQSVNNRYQRDEDRQIRREVDKNLDTESKR